MMLSNIAPMPSFHTNQKQHQSFLLVKNYPSLTRTRTPPRRSCTTIFFKFISLDDIAQVAHNKVLVAAAVSAGTGQLLKPFSSSWLYGKDFSLSSAIQAGGFPSTHSSAVIATATSIALERGFADPIFGMAVVYASLVMYDAQGVRREVGTHAKALNQILPKKSSASPVSSADNTRDPTTFPFLKPSSSDQNNLPKSSPTSTLIRSSSSNVINVNSSEDDQTSLTILKESIGHTEVEVIAGGLLGFLVSLAVSNIL
ncbi:unnamed protein product [Rhodiola kirilowii]